MWETTVNGRLLHFHLAGINNQNFIMRDEETGSWWQQITGKAILGPLQGQQLVPVFHDELTFALWKREKPQGRILRPDEAVARAGHYAPADWEQRMARVRVATSQELDASLGPRTLIVGLAINRQSEAIPFDALLKQNLILEDLGGAAIFIVLGEDKRSVRAFERLVEGRKLEFFVKQQTDTWRLVDAETGSEWDFAGRALTGPLSGKQLKPVPVLSDYWFDWKTYHPDTRIYALGNR